MDRLRQFLWSSNENGSLSVKPPPPKVADVQFIKELINDGRGTQVVEEIIMLCKNKDTCLPLSLKKYSIFVLALCARSADLKTKQAAYKAFPQICIHSDELFRFVDHCEMFSGKFSGWGRAHKAAISSWYNDQKPLHLAAKVTQCLESRKWTHKDLFTLAHITPTNTGTIWTLSERDI